MPWWRYVVQSRADTGAATSCWDRRSPSSTRAIARIRASCSSGCRSTPIRTTSSSTTRCSPRRSGSATRSARCPARRATLPTRRRSTSGAACGTASDVWAPRSRSGLRDGAWCGRRAFPGRARAGEDRTRRGDARHVRRRLVVRVRQLRRPAVRHRQPARRHRPHVGQRRVGVHDRLRGELASADVAVAHARRQLFGSRPAGAPRVNLALHVANALLLFAFFARDDGRGWPERVRRRRCSRSIRCTSSRWRGSRSARTC